MPDPTPPDPEPELTPGEYEELTRQIVAALANVDGTETVRLEHDVILTGKVHDHQIDVVWDYRRDGLSGRIVFECRRFKQNLKNTHVWAFKSIVEDLVEPATGVMVTQTGYQEAALKVGRAHKIDLWTLRQPTAADWAGRVRDIEVRGVPLRPNIADLDLDLNVANVTSDGDQVLADQDSVFVLPDAERVRLGDVLGYWLEVVGSVASTADLVAMSKDFPEGTVVVTRDGTEIPVRSMSARVGLVPDEDSAMEIAIRGDDIVAFVLHRLFGDRRFVIGDDGTIREVDNLPEDEH